MGNVYICPECHTVILIHDTKNDFECSKCGFECNIDDFEYAEEDEDEEGNLDGD